MFAVRLCTFPRTTSTAALQSCESDAQVPAHGSFTPHALRACVRANFAASQDASTDEQGLLLDRAFSALRILSEQMHMQQCSSHAVTGGIQVEVTSAFIGVNTNHPSCTEQACIEHTMPCLHFCMFSFHVMGWPITQLDTYMKLITWWLCCRRCLRATCSQVQGTCSRIG